MKFLMLNCLVVLSLGCMARSRGPYSAFETFTSLQNIAPTEACDERCVGLKKEFRYVVFAGEQAYCYWDQKQAETKTDYKALADQLENQITTQTSDTDYYFILWQWGSAFHDGHVNPRLKDDLSKIEFYNPVIRFELIAPDTDHEELIVAQVGDGVKTLKVGAVVESINGIAAADLINGAEAFSFGSTRRMRRWQTAATIPRYLLKLQGPRALAVTAHLEEKKLEETVARNLTLVDAPTPPPSLDSGLKLIKAMIVGDNLGYLRIDGFQGEKMPELLNQALDRLSSTSGLLIDVRKNGGGDLSGDAVIARLIGEDKVRFYQKTRRSDFLAAIRPEAFTEFEFINAAFSELLPRKVKKSKEPQYKNPVFLLTSPNCFSACDTFSAGLKQNGLVTVVGEGTGGGSGTPIVLELPNSGNRFRYSVWQGLKPVTQDLIEGVGTAVDIAIEPTRQERVKQVDDQLQTAFRLLGEKVHGAPSPALPAALLEKPSGEPSALAPELELERQLNADSEDVTPVL